jgi:hypothetical protein
MRTRTRHVAGLADFQSDTFGWQRRRFKNSTPQVPTPADPTTVSNAQTVSNIGTAGAQAAENNTNVVGPNGSTTYSQTGTYTDPTTGASLPTYTQTNTLDPLSQAILTGTKQVGASLVPTAQNLATQAGTSATTPLNFNTADSGVLNSAPSAIDQNATNTIFAGENALLQPTFQQQQTDLQDQLSRAGISVGNPAYSNAETQLGTQQNQATNAALGTATGQGITSANNMFGMALQGQQNNVAQQQLAQTNPLSLLSQIYNGSTGSAAA